MFRDDLILGESKRSGKRELNQQTGMCGVFLAAAELSRRGFNVSLTVRNSRGTDLHVSDPACRKAWTVQAKTNGVPRSFWLLNRPPEESDSHVYVFVNLNDGAKAEYLVVPSAIVSAKHGSRLNKGKKIYWFDREHGEPFIDGWQRVFGEAIGDLAT
jgi:hypothetical protein